MDIRVVLAVLPDGGLGQAGQFDTCSCIIYSVPEWCPVQQVDRVCTHNVHDGVHWIRGPLYRKRHIIQIDMACNAGRARTLEYKKTNNVIHRSIYILWCTIGIIYNIIQRGVARWQVVLCRVSQDNNFSDVDVKQLYYRGASRDDFRSFQGTAFTGEANVQSVYNIYKL